MRHFLRSAIRNPLWIIGVLWPLILLTPFAPGLPKTSGLPLRQEFFFSLLLLPTLALVTRQALQTHRGGFDLQRDELWQAMPLLLFVAWSAASLFWAASTFPALHHTFEWGAYLCFFLLMRRAAANARLLRSSIIRLCVVVWVLGLACAVEYWGAPNDIAIRTGADALFRYFNGFGEMMAVATPLLAALALGLRRKGAAVFCGATATVAWLATFQTLERAPIIGASVALFLLAAASIMTRRFRPRSLKRTLLVSAAFAVVVALQFIPSSLNEGRISAATRLQSTSASEGNLRSRFLFWGIGLEMWREHPLAGVGANNYDTAYPEARAAFSVKHAGSDIIAMDEEMLIERAHNEYVQILAELGVVGFALFLAFCAVLVVAAWRVLRYARGPLALGAVCGLVAFALSSGASSASFRWMGSSLVFFFAAALVAHFAARCRPQPEKRAMVLAPTLARTAAVLSLLFSLFLLGSRSMQAASNVLQDRAASASNPEQANNLFSRAVSWNRLDAPAHYNYGLWLYSERRASEAVPHLRFAVERGFNASLCYEYLAAAEAGAGDLQAAELTLALAVRVYPRSVFLHVRHASALAEIGQKEQADAEYATALALNQRLARGWRQLICFGQDAAMAAAFYDKGIAPAGELAPENCISAVLNENERRTPVAALDENSHLEAASP